mmetsp:Transcript_3469/g.7650  ORF Transcript_3469/g.7650 Transcript_3469/m.7650 type:complete len:221 (+) Transcript_3469:2870-3532(+)
MRWIISHDGLLVRDALYSKTCLGLLAVRTVALTELAPELGLQICFEDSTDLTQIVIVLTHFIPPRESEICIGSETMNKHGDGISSLVNSKQANDGDGPVLCPQSLLFPIGILGQRRAPNHVNVQPLQIQVILMGLPRGRGNSGTSPTRSMGIGNVTKGDILLSRAGAVGYVIIFWWRGAILINHVVVHIFFVVELFGIATTASEALGGLFVEAFVLVAFP